MSLLRIGLCILFAGSVLAFGGVEVWTGSLIEIGAAALFVFWALLVALKSDGRVYWSPLNWPLLGFLAIGLVQIATHATAYAFLTRVQLLKLAAYFLIFFLATQAFRTREDLGKITWFLIVLCFAVSLFGIIQHFTSSQEIYWSEAIKTEGEPFGPYVNRNHFAGFVELTLPLGLAMIVFRGVHREVLPLTALLTIVPVSALVLSGSRGGIIGFAFEVGILVLLVRSRRTAWKSPRVIAAGAVGLVALAMVAWVGASTAIERFSALKSPEVPLGRRISMARGAAHIFLDHPIIGCGVGTLVDVFPRYETAYDGKLVDHVHNDYMETLAETGLLGGLCGAIFLWLLYREARKSFEAEQGHFSRALHAGAITAASGLLLHSLVDFNLQIPANMMLFLLQACLATSPPVNSNSPTKRRAEVS
jgi:O-antigen ligase